MSGSADDQARARKAAARRALPQRCTRHRARGYRDVNGREIGALCLACGTIIARAKVDDETLRLGALIFLIREEAGEVELEPEARRRLQAIRRRAAREEARRNRETQEDRT